MNPDNPIYMAYWGKAASEGETPAKHLLVFHLLDVAAVGRVLLSRHPTLLTRLSGLTGVSAGDLAPWLVWLLAHHDFGKFAAAFQRLRPQLFPEPLTDRYRYDTRHDTLGYLLWEEKLLDEVFPDLAGQYELEEAVSVLLRTSAGHHGKPPEVVEWKTSWFRDEDVQAARLLSRDLSRLFFGRDAPPELSCDNPGMFARRIASSSWPLAGFAVLCDWIGSNRLWFPFADEPIPLGRYWEKCALPQAERAVNEAAVVPVPPAEISGFRSLFPEIAAPTGLQEAAETAPLAIGPQLYFIEDLTGSGKTEAALTLTGRLLSAGKGEGIYVALPTTATADAMYDRVGNVYRKLFSHGTRPSLVLAHSRRDLSERFRTSVGGDRIEPEAAYGDGEEGAAATCAAWLADNRKKGLLAQVGVGTIDQALLAALNVRHQSLRAFGLLGKVLLVDEVHACDAYMNRILEHLLRLHAAMGGSAVLLSATLPIEARFKLAVAFSEGAGFALSEDLPDGYPQLLAIAADDVWNREVEAPPWARRTLRVDLLHDPESAVDWVAGRAETGACVAWVRNTVRDAAEAYDLLAERLGAERVTLFHARFALGDRLRIEKDVLARFDKKSRADRRAGRVVIATQVVEQSLDLDFDEMLSDLAPIDLLLQRAGRLRRHPRDTAGNPLSANDAPDERGEPVLHVLCPEPVDEPGAGWIRGFLPGTAAVYRHHGHLWRTARYLAENATLHLPEDSRTVIQAVFGSSAQDGLPATLDRNVCEAEGGWRADASLAELNTIKVGEGYGGGFGSWTDRDDARTRLGEPTVTLRLARWDGSRLHPMVEAPPNPWALSEVSVRRSQIETIAEPEDPPIAAALQELEASFLSGHQWFLLVPLMEEADGIWSCSGCDSEGQPVVIRYTARRGLEVQK